MHFLVILMNQSMEGAKAINKMKQFEDAIIEAYRRAKMMEAAFTCLKEVLAKVEADLA